MTFTITDKTLSLRGTWSQTSDIQKNTSVIHLENLEFMTTKQYGNFWIMGSIHIGGNLVHSFVFSNSTGSRVPLALNQYVGIISVGGGFEPPYDTPAIPHQNDGTASVTVSVDLTLLMNGNYSIQQKLAGSAELTLDSLPRASELKNEGSTLGSSMKLKLTRAVSTFRDTVSYSCGSSSGTIAAKTAATELNWTPPLALAAANTMGKTVTITFTVSTYKGDTLVGSRKVEVSCTIPNTVVPTLEVTVSDPTGFAGQYGAYIQNQSQIRVQTNAAGVYGSTVAKIGVTCGTLTGQGADIRFVPPNAGSMALTVRVTDSRGYTASHTRQLAVTAYAAPTVTLTGAERCDSEGGPKADGAYVRVVYRASVTSLEGRNAAEYTAQYRVRGSGSWSSTASEVFAASVDKSYEVRMKVADAFGVGYSGILTVQAAFALLDFCRETRAIGLGQRANAAETVSVGCRVKMNGSRITDLGAAVDAGDALTKGAADAAYWHPRLLWTNSSPTASFAAKTVSLTLTGFVLVEGRYSTSGDKRSCSICPVGAAGQLICAASDGTLAVREYQVNANGIVFQAAAKGNGYAIPTRIYIL